jgi:hypothetical protein
MEDQGKGTWCGKRLEDMSRAELYSTIEEMDKNQRAQAETHERQYKILFSSKRPQTFLQWLVS